MKRHLAAVSVAGAFAAAVLVPAASADPVHAKNAFTVQAMCGTHVLTAVTNGNGEFSPAHITGTGNTAVFVPTKFDLWFTFTPAGSTQTFTNHDTSTKNARVKNTITCTIGLQSFTSPQGTMTIQGSVTGFLTPRSG
jgi:hypothetical protein